MFFRNLALHRSSSLVIGLLALTVATTAFAGYENTAQAEATDAAILAGANGWTTQQALDLASDSAIFAELVQDVIASYSSDYSGAVFMDAPNGSCSLYFKGSVPAGVASLINLSGLSVNTYGGIGKNHVEWDQQVQALTDFLIGEEVVEYVVAFDSIDNIEVTIGSGQSAPTLPNLLASDVTVTGGVQGSLIERHYIRVLGGSQMWKGTSTTGCTSSWNVIQTNTMNNGFASAGHCDSPSVRTEKISDEPGTTKVVADYQAVHMGAWGDFSWFDTDSWHPAEFFADEDTVRPVTALKTWWFRNEIACLFGRSSGVRECSRIHRVAVNTHGHRELVAMRDRWSIGGDSGGGWSHGTQAIGVHLGLGKVDGAWRELFSKASRLDEALGVEIRLTSP